MRSHYEILGVAPRASAEEIRSAYRRLARIHHPDRAASPSDGATKGGRSHPTSSAARRMARINAAWDVLGDEPRRRAYDQSLGLTGGSVPPPRTGPTAWSPLPDDAGGGARDRFGNPDPGTGSGRSGGGWDAYPPADGGPPEGGRGWAFGESAVGGDGGAGVPGAGFIRGAPPAKGRPGDLIVMAPFALLVGAVGLFGLSMFTGSAGLRSLGLIMMVLSAVAFGLSPLVAMTRSRPSRPRSRRG
ncbi:MAG: J domain-containing protein [Acidimicrobiales bacterium]